jgi:hypothetical protein
VFNHVIYFMHPKSVCILFKINLSTFMLYFIFLLPVFRKLLGLGMKMDFDDRDSEVRDGFYSPI